MSWEFIREFVFAILFVLAGVWLVYRAKNLDTLARSVVARAEEAVKQRLGPEKYEQLRKVVTDAVYAVEQTSKNEKMTSEEKKALAMQQAKNLLALAGLKDEVDDKTLDLLIEGAVFLMNLVTKSSSAPSPKS